MPEVFVGMGSNVEPERYFPMALAELERRFGPIRRSTVLRTAAVGFDGDAFLNMVVGWETGLSVEALMAELAAVEVHCGRTRADQRFGPRTMDLDLLLYGNRVSEVPPLPRPEILEYDFVLGPLAELVPETPHPVLGLTFGRLWEERRGQISPMEAVSIA